jgi:hypothetical protein
MGQRGCRLTGALSTEARSKHEEGPDAEENTPGSPKLWIVITIREVAPMPTPTHVLISPSSPLLWDEHPVLLATFGLARIAFHTELRCSRFPKDRPDVSGWSGGGNISLSSLSGTRLAAAWRGRYSGVGVLRSSGGVGRRASTALRAMLRRAQARPRRRFPPGAPAKRSPGWAASPGSAATARRARFGPGWRRGGPQSRRGDRPAARGSQ